MSIRFFVFSDLHYDTVEDGDERISKIIRKVKENQLDFCISLGDFCEPVLENKRLVNAFLQTRVPMYYTIGNHETDRHHLDEILVFYDMKSPFYSFELENYKFIVLNTCFYSKDGVEEAFYENNYKVKGSVYPVLPQEQLNWLREELDDHKKHIVFSHHSFSNEFAKRGVQNRDTIQNMFSARNVLLCMNGHDHGDAVIQKNGTTYYTVNSSSNVWIGSQIDSSETLKEKYSHLNGILTYKEPFAVIVEIDDSKIKINGVEGEYQSVTPEDIGLDNYQWNGVSILPKASSWEINLFR